MEPYTYGMPPRPTRLSAGVVVIRETHEGNTTVEAKAVGNEDSNRLSVSRGRVDAPGILHHAQLRFENIHGLTRDATGAAQRVLLIGKSTLREQNADEHDANDPEDGKDHKYLDQRERGSVRLITLRCVLQHVVHNGLPDAGRVRSMVTESGRNSPASGSTTIRML